MLSFSSENGINSYSTHKTNSLKTGLKPHSSNKSKQISSQLNSLTKLEQRIQQLERNTTKNTVISLISWCGNLVEKQTLRESPETMLKLCLSIKFPYQEITWNYGIFHSEMAFLYNHIMLLHCWYNLWSN